MKRRRPSGSLGHLRSARRQHQYPRSQRRCRIHAPAITGELAMITDTSGRSAPAALVEAAKRYIEASGRPIPSSRTRRWPQPTMNSCVNSPRFPDPRVGQAVNYARPWSRTACSPPASVPLVAYSGRLCRTSKDEFSVAQRSLHCATLLRSSASPVLPMAGVRRAPVPGCRALCAAAYYWQSSSQETVNSAVVECQVIFH